MIYYRHQPVFDLMSNEIASVLRYCQNNGGEQLIQRQEDKMRVALVLMIGVFFWLVTPAVSDAHQVKKHDNHGYSNQYEGNWGHEVRNKQHNRHQQKAWKKNKAWKKHRKNEKRWARRHERLESPIRVVYRDRFPFPLFPRVVINFPF